MANLLGNFGPALTYEVFIHLGLVTAIPVSAGESLDYIESSETKAIPNRGTFFTVENRIEVIRVACDVILCFCLLNQSARRHVQRRRLRGDETSRHHHDRQRLSLGAVARKLARLPHSFAQVKDNGQVRHMQRSLFNYFESQNVQNRLAKGKRSFQRDQREKVACPLDLENISIIIIIEKGPNRFSKNILVENCCF